MGEHFIIGRRRGAVR